MAEYTLHSRKGETDTEAAVDPVFGDIRKEWHWVKRGIEEILSLDPQLTFRPEDVYAACVNQQAVLWVNDEGFVVSTTEVDPFNEEKTMLLWLAWAKKRGGDLVSKHGAFFEKVACEAGYSKLETRSSFMQLMPHLTERGWTIDTVVYVRNLNGQRTKKI